MKIRRYSKFLAGLATSLILLSILVFPAKAIEGRMTTLSKAINATEGTNSFTGSASVPDQVTFTSTGDMNVGHIFHTATLLKNGKVLVAGGGSNSTHFSTSAELYDPDTGTWTLTGSMNIGRERHTATLLNNGKVLVAGGLTIEGDKKMVTDSASAELYDPATGTWTLTGSMNTDRYLHTATLLNNGKVLVVGGATYYLGAPLEAELYDPVAGTWSSTSPSNIDTSWHTATLLNNGKVLVAGGSNGGSDSLTSASLYDPVANTWSSTGSMNFARGEHTATLLNNGKVLVAGGGTITSPLTSTELYDPITGTWSTTTESMNTARWEATATLLNNGQVLVAGGQTPNTALTSAELYDPTTGIWNTTNSMSVGRSAHTTTLLNNGKVLVAGGATISSVLASAELGTLIPSNNTLTGTLTLPSGWLNSTTISAQFVGTSSAAAINAGALSNDGSTWGDWIASNPDETITTTWDVGSEGSNKPVYLRLRDVNGQVANVVSGTVNVDLTKPTSTMTVLPAFSTATIQLSWSGSDELSSVSTYDVQVRAGTDGAWTDVLSNTTDTSTNYTGANGITYYFRSRARDVAGNVEDWPNDYDTFTLVDSIAPNGTVIINGGALTTTSTDVSLGLSATDIASGVAQMSFANDGSTWSGWQVYATSASWTVSTGDGTKTVYARFEDVAGNVSSPVSTTIVLDTTVDTEYGLTINDGAMFTNQTAVALTISARPGTAQMQVSNDGGFAGAVWEPYTSHKDWTITQYGSYVIPRVVYIRYKDVSGNISSNYQDDIILDVTPPTGSVNISASAGLQPMTSGVTLELSATDDVSGVGQMLISNQPDLSDAIWEPYATSKAWVLESNRTVYVRFRDNAGNISTTYSASLTTNWSIFLPLIMR